MPRFSETLLEHARYPRNFGRGEEADLVGRASLGGGPPHVELYLRVEGNKIVKASFHAAGCGVTVGACSALTELVEGATVVQARMVESEHISHRLNGVPRDKAISLHLAIAALREALAELP